MSEAITRTEYDDKNTAIQLSLAALTAATAANGSAISTLISGMDKQREITENLRIKAAKSEAIEKILWPAVSALLGVIGFLVGMKFF